MINTKQIGGRSELCDPTTINIWIYISIALWAYRLEGWGPIILIFPTRKFLLIYLWYESGLYYVNWCDRNLRERRVSREICLVRRAHGCPCDVANISETFERCRSDFRLASECQINTSNGAKPSSVMRRRIVIIGGVVFVVVVVVVFPRVSYKHQTKTGQNRRMHHNI